MQTSNDQKQNQKNTLSNFSKVSAFRGSHQTRSNHQRKKKKGKKVENYGPKKHSNT